MKKTADAEGAVMDKHLINRAPFGYALCRIVLDKKGDPVDYEFVSVNRMFEKLAGLKKESIAGKKAVNIREFAEDDFAAHISLYFEVAVKGVHLEYDHYSSSLKRWYKVQVHSPKKFYFSKIFTDITYQHTIADASGKFNQTTAENVNYNEIAARMAEISGASYAVLNIFDKNGRDFTTAGIKGISSNIEKAAKMIGFNFKGKKWEYDLGREELIRDRKIIYFNRLRDLTRDVVPAAVVAVIEKTFNTGRVALVKSTKDNVMLGDFTLIFGKNRYLKNPALVEAYSDLTGMLISRIRAEEELVAEKYQAEKANKTKSRFLASMSHEIRTPLNAVIGFTELLGNTPLNKTQGKYLESAAVSARSLMRIIDDILDFSKIEAGRVELDLVKTDLLELLGEAYDIISYQASKKGLELLLNINTDVPRIAVVDPLRLKQILINLLGNAVKFTEKGEIELKVSFNRVEENQGRFTFVVRDTGIGISREQKEKLFKAFSQADSSTSRKYGGTGLGLVISALLAKKMGSSIELDSEPGRGSTFFFSIETGFEEIRKFDSGKLDHLRRVMVIDNNENTRGVTLDMLKNWDIYYRECSSEDEAAEQLNSSENFDLIIADYHNSCEEGTENVKRLRYKLKGASAGLPVVLLCKSDEDPDQPVYYDGGNICIRLSKPVKPGDFFSVLLDVNNRSKRGAEYINGKTGDDDTPGQVKVESVVNNSTFRENPVILLAEDVSTNMFLLSCIIKDFIPSAEIIEASEGNEVVEVFEHRSPDLVITDIQMPGMDGLEATRVIREKEARSDGRVPVIALSASSVEEKREECLEAGMDDFLTKPVKLGEIKRILEKYLGKSCGKEIKGRNAGDSGGEIHFNREEFLERVNENEEIERKMMRKVLSVFPGYIKSLEKAAEDNNTEAITDSAHKLKGAALNMCLEKLARLASVAEDTGCSDLDSCNHLLNDIVSEWETVKEILSKTYC